MVTELFASSDQVETGMTYVLFVITVIGSIFGAYKGWKWWVAQRRETVASRVRREDALNKVIEQVATTNGGSTLLDKVNLANTQLTQNAEKIDGVKDDLLDHTKAAQGYFDSNDKAHAEIHRRIDGVFELIAGKDQTQPRRIADRHAQRSASAVSSDEVASDE